MRKNPSTNLDITPHGTGTSTKLPRRSTPLKNIASFRDVLSDVKNLPLVLELPDVTPAALEIGQTIRRVRVAQGMTQVSLAEAAGISQAALSDIELGKGSDGPSYRILREIARALGLEFLQKESVGENVEIKADPSDVIMIAEGSKDCVAYAPSIDGLIKVLFDKNEVSDVCVRLRKFGGKVKWGMPDDYQCTMLRVEPHAHMRVATLAPAVFVILSGQVTVKSARSSLATMKQGYIIPGNETVDVVNPRRTPSSFLSVPAGCFFSVADWE